MTDVFEPIYGLLRKEKYFQALDALITNNHKTINSPYDIDMNHAWYLVGDAYYMLGDYQNAISAFKRALDIWPDDKDAVLALANSYSKLGYPKNSERVVLSALGKWPQDSKLLYNLANALYDQKRYDKSILRYMEALKDPEIEPLARSNIRLAKKEMKRKK